MIVLILMSRFGLPVQYRNEGEGFFRQGFRWGIGIYGLTATSR
ncbi:hypothetical protein NB311A_00220 [Nitrobacter sp. Nb-311A]|nr:hypothetical protein NB311A_00220 [Nitrobacter sp. Nb-311A]